MCILFNIYFVLVKKAKKYYYKLYKNLNQFLLEKIKQIIIFIRVIFLFKRKNMTQKELKVNKDACIWCGVCVAICDKIFDFDDQKKSKIIKQPETEQEFDCVKESIDACCVEAIYFEEKILDNNK